MPVRTVIFWLHLTAGVVAGTVVLIMSATGVLLTYEKQMVAWAEQVPQAAPPLPESARLPVEDLLASAWKARPDATPATIIIRADRAEPVTVSFGRDGQLLLNAYTGAVIGEGATSLRAFFRSVTDWHRWLAASGEYRNTGKAVTGACNLAFLVLIVTGAYLWLPKAWSRVQLRNIVWFRRGLPGKARDFNWHNTIGLWSFVPLFVVVLSATVISYPWASNLAYRVMGEEPPAPQRPAQGRESATASRPPSAQGRESATAGRHEAGTEVPAYGGISLAAAERQVAGWRAITLRVPASDQAPLVYTIDTGWAGEPHKRGTLTVDRATGAVAKWETFASNSPGRRLRTILRFAHTGEVLGLTGQTIAGIASAGAVVLVYTGIALSLRRFAAWRRRRGAATTEAAA
jgi:uncharacterized iron-regulated membrane protein